MRERGQRREEHDFSDSGRRLRESGDRSRSPLGPIPPRQCGEARFHFETPVPQGFRGFLRFDFGAFPIAVAAFHGHLKRREHAHDESS